jgi:uncharacterized protein (UPF0147 family)
MAELSITIKDMDIFKEAITLLYEITMDLDVPDDVRSKVMDYLIEKVKFGYGGDNK